MGFMKFEVALQRYGYLGILMHLRKRVPDQLTKFVGSVADTYVKNGSLSDKQHKAVRGLYYRFKDSKVAPGRVKPVVEHKRKKKKFGPSLLVARKTKPPPTSLDLDAIMDQALSEEGDK